MNSIHQIKAAAATLMVGFLLAIGLAATAQAANGTLKAEQVRGQALNRYYGLGAFSPAAEARRAGKIRGRELNRYYHLGSYAVISVPSRFDWADAGIGAGAMLGTILLVGGIGVAVRRRPDRSRRAALGDLNPGSLQ
jgi:hypothetical protein